MAAMYWCMPTPKAERRMFIAPLAGWVFLLPNAAVKGIPSRTPCISTVAA
ncbi:hypothetical protein ACWDSD_05980 [Streptomyces spiralis]